MYELIKRFEGFKETAYLCPAGLWTIGYGFTHYLDGSPVKEGDYMSKMAAEAYLTHYVNKIKLPAGEWNKEQIEALQSLIFNIGQAAFDKSTLKKRLEEGDFVEAKREWGRWKHSDGKVLPGLEKRRKAEIALFFKENDLKAV